MYVDIDFGHKVINNTVEIVDCSNTDFVENIGDIIYKIPPANITLDV